MQFNNLFQVSLSTQKNFFRNLFSISFFFKKTNAPDESIIIRNALKNLTHFVNLYSIMVHYPNFLKRKRKLRVFPWHKLTFNIASLLRWLHKKLLLWKSRGFFSPSSLFLNKMCRQVSWWQHSLTLFKSFSLKKPMNN